MTVSEAYNTLLALSRADKPYSSAEESIISNLYTEVLGKKVRDCNSTIYQDYLIIKYYYLS